MNEAYEVLRIMNNNVVLAKNLDKDIEVVLMGKGIGFGQKKGHNLSTKTSKIEKIFKAGLEGSLKANYLKMLQETSGDIVEVCTEILLVAEKKLGRLSDRSFIVVVDHISFAIEKIAKKIEIDNPFVYEIQNLYPEEYAIGEFARQLILEKLQVDIAIDEVGFIALHLHAAKEDVVVTDTLKTTRIIKQMAELIGNRVGFDLKKDSLINNQLLSQLRGLMHRIDNEQPLSKHPLHETVIRACMSAYEIVMAVENMLINEKKQMGLTDKFYLTLYIDRLLRGSNNKMIQQGGNDE